MKPSGAHTHPGMGGGSKALVVLAVVVGAAIAEPVAHAASSFLRVAVEALDVIVIVVASAVGLAVVAGLAYLVGQLRLRYLQRVAVLRSSQPPLVIRESAQAVSSTPEPVAEIEGRHDANGRQQVRHDPTDGQPLAIAPPTSAIIRCRSIGRRRL